MARLYTKNAAQLFQKHVENEQEPKWGLAFQLRYQLNMALKWDGRYRARPLAPR
jgi:hypothetical protein